MTDALEVVAAVASMSIGDTTYIWVSESGETIIGGGFASTGGTTFSSLWAREAPGLFWFSNSASDFSRIGGKRDSPSGDSVRNGRHHCLAVEAYQQGSCALRLGQRLCPLDIGSPGPRAGKALQKVSWEEQISRS